MEHNALLLSGGGARAAYQVGVVKALTDIFPQEESLFDVYSGVSAGAINALALACNNEQWQKAAGKLVQTWQSFHVERIYMTDQISLLRTAWPWIKTLVPLLKKNTDRKPLFFLDNSPLKTLLEQEIELSKLQTLIENGQLHAAAVSCSSYHSGQSVTFFQGKSEIPNWQKERRIGVRTDLTPDHMLASSALPLIFPAQCINNEWFGDGSMRQIAPLSSCIHLDASRILVVGTGKNAQFETKSLQHPDMSLSLPPKPYPSVAQIGAHILNGLFVDSLYADMERFNRTHELIQVFGQKTHEHVGPASGDLGDSLRPKINFPSRLRPIELFVINPSQKIDEIASSFVHELPQALLKLLRRIGATEKMGGGLASYLLFEPSYVNALIELGYSDAWSQKEALVEFFAPRAPAAPQT